MKTDLLVRGFNLGLKLRNFDAQLGQFADCCKTKTEKKQKEIKLKINILFIKEKQ
jgi:hypothetical protein